MSAKPLMLAAALAAAGANAADLDFSKQPHTAQTMQVNGQTVQYRAFENIPYVNNPVEANYQTINIYIPEAYFHGGSINGYTADTAPIFLPNKIGGYMPAKAGVPGQKGRGGEDKGADAMQVALSRGLVVASPGARGRTSPTGKAPAAIVDLKAAVRYLKANDKAMAGDARKIISNGTSAGGALSVLLGASANQRDYAGRLKKLGAAEANDSIFAVSAYCPISILEHADAAYEWQFHGVNDYQKMNITMLDYNVERKLVKGTLTAAEKQLSGSLKPQFAPYLNSLKLKNTQGKPLTLDKNGNGSFKDHIAALLAQSAQTALDAGKDLSARNWLTVSGGKVTAVDFDQYAAAAGRQKTPPAFDGVDLSTGENQLFGSADQDKRHFTAFAAQNSTAPNAGRADAQTVKMMSPMPYIAQTPTQYWRIRVGTNDRDTSLAVSAILAAKLQNSGKSVDYALPWDVPHSGDYDLNELFDWIDSIAKEK
ncbi:alpha/beta hydrolase [Kingella sp. SNUBH-2017]|uniref:subtype B tannase n=1 Tax=Kingella sp. SNUBH-2017 TaxID=2994077 RepID=UPI0023640E06|nr:subtype B tannase [Kingella sp. SNUBH-2017]MDD2183821.1 alpha/beta hydrolase [Kingella sp. SNUBH-2017]